MSFCAILYHQLIFKVNYTSLPIVFRTERF